MRIPGSTPFINPLDVPKPDIEVNKQEDKAAITQSGVELERTVRSDRMQSSGASMRAEQRFGGLAQEAMLRSQLDYEEIIPDRPDGPNKVAGPSDLLLNGSNGPEVKDLQHKLNEWRMQNGKPPIAEDGAFGKGTEDALKEYQTATGLKADGIAGPTTKAMLKLEGDSNFRQLSPESKKEVGQYMEKYKDNPAAKENVMNLATDPSFANATPESRGLALLTLSKDPADIDHRNQVKYALADTVKLERSSDFQSLSPDTKSLARLAMLERGKIPEDREYIAELVSNPNFKNLTPAQQEKMMDAIAVNTERFCPAQMMNILNSKGFSVSDRDMQARIIDMASKDANDPQKLSNLSLMLDDPEFVNASKEDRYGQLNRLSGRTGLEI